MKVINRGCLGLAAIVAGALVGGPAAVASGSLRPFTVKRAPFRAVPSFTISYQGSGSVHTRYHSRPPNPGGNPDTNDADDAGTQRWSIAFQQVLTVPACGPVGLGRVDPCARVKSLHGAVGTSSATGVVQHKHVDGLFAAYNAAISCRESVKTPKGLPLIAALSVSYLPRRHAFAFTALNPVVTTLGILPGACPGQGDPIDGLFDNYFTPGFSFSPHYGADRWFTSRTVVISTAVLRRAGVIKMRLRLTSHGTPPRNCAVPFPAYQRCTTGGSWSGVLTMRRKR